MNITSVINAVKGIANVDAAKRLLLIGTGFVRKNAPQFLTAASVISLGGAVVSTAKATVKSKEIIDDAEFQLFMELREKHGKDYMPEDKEITLPLEEKVKLCWKYYIPAVLSTAASAGCAIASTSIYADRFATVTALLALSEADNKELKAKMEELLGKDTVVKIQEAIGDDHIKEAAGVEKMEPIPKEQMSEFDFSKPYPVVDTFGAKWYASYKQIQAAINRLNEHYQVDECAALNDFYGYMDTSGSLYSGIGDMFGWDKDVFGDNIRIWFEPKFDEIGNVFIAVKYMDLPEPYSGSSPAYYAYPYSY